MPIRFTRSRWSMIIALLLVALGTATLTGCNTARGAGEDAKNAGKAVKKAVD